MKPSAAPIVGTWGGHARGIETMEYHVEMDNRHAPDTPVGGCGCGCTGNTVASVVPIEECSLTPGDPSPAGRCPDCDGLVYVDTAQSRAQDAAMVMLKALQNLIPWAEGAGLNVDEARDAVAAAT